MTELQPETLLPNEYEELCTAQFVADEVLVHTVPSADALRLLEVKSSVLHPYAFSLRKLRNSVLPLYRLPFEIFAEIFSILFFDNANNWRACTSISCYLRSIALSSSHLWSNVDLVNRRVAQMFINRCPAGPIDLCYDNNRKGSFRVSADPIDLDLLSTDVREIVHRYMDRVRTIRISAEHSEITALYPSFYRGGSHLRHLMLHCTSPRIISSWSPNDETDYAVDIIHLSRVHIPWTSNIYHNVTILTLKHQGAVLVSMGTFLVVLHGCTALRTLVLCDAGPVFDSTVAEPTKPNILQMPNLHQLTLENPPQDVAYLLAHVGLPITTELHINTAMLHIENCFFDVLPRNRDSFRHLSGIRSVKFDSNSILEFHANTFHLTLSTKSGEDEDVQYVDEVIGRPLIQFLDELSDAPLLENLDIRIENYHVFEEDAWRDVLLRVPNLRSLEFWYHEEDMEVKYPRIAFFSAAINKQKLGIDPLCPLLESLTIHLLRFSDNIVSRTINEFLRLQIKIAAKLKTLKLVQAVDLPDEQVERFRLLVDNFEYTAWEEPLRSPFHDGPVYVDIREHYSGESDSNDSS